MQTNIEVNKYNTLITEELLDKLDITSQVDFHDSIERIMLLKRMISPDRKRAKDLPRDKFGKIIVDIENPHILENMSYFTERADFFRKHGKYTDLYPNSNPNSEYRKFWDEERRRCEEGYIRESDGEWISGYFYFYLNYSRIDIVVPLEDIKDGKDLAQYAGGVRSERIEDFPKIWDGDYLYFHYIEQAEKEGKHCAVLKCRGRGYSFKGGAMLARNYFIIRKSKSYALASEQEYLVKDGLLTKTWTNINYIDNHTPWTQPRDYKDTENQKRASYKDIENKTEKGFMSEVIGVTCKDNPNKARGKRGKLLLFEEAGKFPGLATAWTVARKSVEQGRYVYGTMCSFGTGGTEGADFEALERFFYSPSGYNIKQLNNIFDKTYGSGVCGLFIPEYLNRESCYDEDGNSDVVKALIEIMLQRQTIRNNTNDPSTLIGEKAEAPITPQEAVLRKEGSLFPIGDLKEYLSEITPHMQKFVSAHYVGKFVMGSDGEVKFKNDEDLSPIRDFPLMDINKEGAVEIFELPKNTDSLNRYIIGCLTPGEKVMTDMGLTGVEDVTLDRKLINKEGNLVKIKNLQKYNVVNEDVYKFRMCNTFRTTTFTKEHPIYASESERRFISYGKSKRLGISQRYHMFNFQFVKAEKVKVGDYIKVPNTYIKENDFDYTKFWINDNERIDRLINNPLQNKDFWWFIGLWLGDGWCENNGYDVSMSFNVKEEFYINKLKTLITTTFNRKFSERVRDNCVEIKFSFQQLNTFLNKNFGKYAIGKKIPEWVKRLPINLKKELILGYLNSDGCIGDNGYTEFVSINLEMLEGVQDILFSLGIISSLELLRKASRHTFKNGKECNTKETYTLKVAQHNTFLLKNILDCEEDIKLKKVKNVSNLRRFPEGGCFFDENKEYIYIQVKEIEKDSYTGDVYNFECDTHTFMCHRITTHNCDTYDDDKVLYSNSLGSCIVFDRWTRNIVAEYTGRPLTADSFYEICYRMARFYNCRIMYENNKKGLYGYFNNVKKAVWMLADTPEFLREKSSFKIDSISTNNSKGINATAEINAYGRRMQASWMLEKFDEIIDENTTIEKLRLFKIRSIGYLKEAIAWNPDINTDRISAMNMVMLYDMDLKQFEEGEGFVNKVPNRFAKDKFVQKFNVNKNLAISKDGINSIWDIPKSN